MKYPALIALTLIAAGCRTSGGASGTVKDAESAATAGGAPVHCAFVTPDGSGDQVEVWATPTDGSQLLDVKSKISHGRDKTPAATSSLGTLAAVDAATVTKGGRHGLRNYSKDLADLDLKNFGCFAVEGAKDPAKVGFFCMPKTATDAKKRAYKSDALWVTNFGRMHFARDLTVYGAKCDR